MLDYHIHTKYCGHASGALEEYVQHALTQPLREIGFADHLPMLKWARPEYAMSFAQLPHYIDEVQQLQQRFPSLHIKLGIEADYYSPEEENATQELLQQYPFDYVYGSVHFIDDWAIDDPRNTHRWDELGVDTIYERYFLLLQQTARSGLFDIISHTDVVKKFGYRPSTDFSALIEETIKCYKETGMVVEINTSGLRKPVQEMYPSPQIIRLLQQYDVPVVFGSDAHSPEDVGKDFAFARKIVRDAGIRELVVFEQRTIRGTIPL